MAQKQRKGLGKNQGKGFKNIIPGQDSQTHSNSAKGIKQPQFANVDALVKKAEGSGKDIEKIGAKTKTEAFFKRAGEKSKKGVEFAQRQVQKFRESQRQKRIKTLEEVNHPLTRKLKAQNRRVEQLKEQIAMNSDLGKESGLFDELSKEQEQLRQLQEEATEIDLSTLSDAELKTLAIRHPDAGLFSEFFGSGQDKYTAELVKRINKKQQVERDLAMARKEAKPGQSSGDGFFEDFFSLN
jgi:hypothetical protein